MHQRILFGCSLLLLLAQPAAGQLKGLKKVVNKANSVLNGGGATPAPVQQGTAAPTEPATTGGGNRSTHNNVVGAGLVKEPPDIPANLATSENAFSKQQYGDARYALQQAMLGVELKIGQAILALLPRQLGTLQKIEGRDVVGSNSWGWSGLLINREYEQGQQFVSLSISNNAAFMQGLGLLMQSDLFTGALQQQENMKKTRFKGEDAVIQYEQSEGYTLTAPVGTTTMLIVKGTNFATEPEFLKAIESIDVAAIKKLLNENQ